MCYKELSAAEPSAVGCLRSFGSGLRPPLRMTLLRVGVTAGATWVKTTSEYP